MTKNVLYCGDNLEILPTMEAESVDLIYVDPPFFSNGNFLYRKKQSVFPVLYSTPEAYKTV